MREISRINRNRQLWCLHHSCISTPLPFPCVRVHALAFFRSGCRCLLGMLPCWLWSQNVLLNSLLVFLSGTPCVRDGIQWCDCLLFLCCTRTLNWTNAECLLVHTQEFNVRLLFCVHFLDVIQGFVMRKKQKLIKQMHFKIFLFLILIMNAIIFLWKLILIVEQ